MNNNLRNFLAQKGFTKHPTDVFCMIKPFKNSSGLKIHVEDDCPIELVLSYEHDKVEMIISDDSISEFMQNYDEYYKLLYNLYLHLCKKNLWRENLV
jgi:hypothetical protein